MQLRQVSRCSTLCAHSLLAVASWRASAAAALAALAAGGKHTVMFDEPTPAASEGTQQQEEAQVDVSSSTGKGESSGSEERMTGRSAEDNPLASLLGVYRWVTVCEFVAQTDLRKRRMMQQAERDV